MTLPADQSSARQRPLVSVVIGSYNRRKFLAEALETVRENAAGMRTETIVVDGGSTDGSIPWLVSQKDVLTIVQHNRGEFRGQPIERRSWGYFMNLAFKCAQGRYVLMLSDDCLLLPGSLANGVARFQALEAEGRKIGGVAFYFRNWPTEQEYYVQRTYGANLMVNHGLFLRDALEAVGWVDEERYHFYKADSDLCLKMWEAGYEIEDCSGAFVEHFVGANQPVRKSNQELVTKDRAAYRERWRGIYWDPDGPELRERVLLAHDDPAQTARRFPKETPSIVNRITRRAQKTSQRVRTRLTGLVEA